MRIVLTIVGAAVVAYFLALGIRAYVIGRRQDKNANSHRHIN